MLDEADFTRDLETPRYRLAFGYQLAEGYYHLGRSWARYEHGGRVRAGFDDFLVKLFGPMQSLMLPAPGEVLEQSQAKLMPPHARAKGPYSA